MRVSHHAVADSCQLLVDIKNLKGIPIGKYGQRAHCERSVMDDIKVMFAFKHIDQKPFCNDKIH